MSAVATAPATSKVSIRRSRIMGIVFIVLGAAAAWWFGFGSEPGLSSTFGLNARDTSFELPDLVLPSRPTALLLATVCAFLGAIQLTRGFGKRATLVLGVVVGCFILAFLIWAARDDSLNFLGMLQSTLLRSVPITLGALAGVLCERSGVINIAIEGMMLTAAFMGALIGSAAGSIWVGLLLGLASGGLLGALLAVLSIRYRVDQIIGGTVINILALGLTSYLSTQVLTQYQNLNNPGRFPVVRIPLLSEIPIIGPLFFSNNIFVYLMFILVFGINIALFRSRWGLRVRAVGEHPKAADTVGIKVLGVRYRNVILGGMVAGLAGAYFTLGSVGRFDENMTAGRGFIALAAMIFGRYNPVGAFGAALVFGFADSLQNKLAILQVPIASEFLLMAPYIATILVVAGLVGRARPPAADGQPYIKE
ncbi:MAG: ABC transporter permease [Actinomycetota bacterium]